LPSKQLRKIIESPEETSSADSGGSRIAGDLNMIWAPASARMEKSTDPAGIPLGYRGHHDLLPTIPWQKSPSHQRVENLNLKVQGLSIAFPVEPRQEAGAASGPKLHKRLG
jgi:hypothetical protein